MPLRPKIALVLPTPGLPRPCFDFLLASLLLALCLPGSRFALRMRRQGDRILRNQCSARAGGPLLQVPLATRPRTCAAACCWTARRLGGRRRLGPRRSCPATLMPACWSKRSVRRRYADASRRQIARARDRGAGRVGQARRSGSARWPPRRRQEAKAQSISTRDASIGRFNRSPWSTPPDVADLLVPNAGRSIHHRAAQRQASLAQSDRRSPHAHSPGLFRPARPAAHSRRKSKPLSTIRPPTPMSG